MLSYQLVADVATIHRAAQKASVLGNSEGPWGQENGRGPRRPRLCLSAYYERAFRKGVAAAPPLSMRYGLPDPPAHQRKKAVRQHSPRNHQGHVEEVVNVD